MGVLQIVTKCVERFLKKIKIIIIHLKSYQKGINIL